jgi:hypothetical protein
MKFTTATDTCEVVATQLVRDLETARKLADDIEPLLGWQIERFKLDAVRLKNDLVQLAAAAKRKPTK